MNYVKLNTRVCKQEYAYFDLPDYYADNLFRQNKVRIKIITEMAKEDSPYVVIFCSVPKKDCEAFETAMKALENKMLVCGHTDYPEFCREFLKKHHL